MTATIRLGCCALALLAASTSWSMGSAEAGAAKSATCLACHGPNGNSSNPEFPSLAGQNAAYIEHQLHLLHDGGRAGTASDATLDELERHWRSQLAGQYARLTSTVGTRP